LDYILVSTCLTEHIGASGAKPFNFRVLSNHCGFFINFAMPGFFYRALNILGLFDQDDFEPNKSSPIGDEFDPSKQQEYRADPALDNLKRKQQRLAAIHEKLGHLEFPCLKLLARAGLIPCELAHIDPPVCPGCAYGKAHRRPWRHKGSRNSKPIKPATFPGQVVSVDQLISPTEGFVPTHHGTPMTQRYIGATIFVDHFSGFTYVHLITKLDADSTVEAKLAFEQVSASRGVLVKRYHADNGLFDTKIFQAAVLQSQQSLTFCGVNAHHQNGRAESRIKDVTTHAQTSLLHAAHQWPKAINAALWPAPSSTIPTRRMYFLPNL
jgi:hypothetical protein